MKINIISISLVLASITSYSTAVMDPDSLISYKGIVTEQFSGKPLAGISVVYKKIPYESEVGILTTNKNGEFEAYFRLRDSYSLKIASENYLSLSEIIHPHENINSNLKRTDKFELKLADGGLFSLHNLIFEQGQSKISEVSFLEINNLLKLLENSSTMKIQLEGHTDFRGSPSANLKLSKDRVNALKDYLVAKGIDEKRILTKAFGGAQPISHGDTNEARSKNRRVEVRIISQ